MEEDAELGRGGRDEWVTDGVCMVLVPVLVVFVVVVGWVNVSVAGDVAGLAMLMFPDLSGEAILAMTMTMAIVASDRDRG